MDARFGPFGLMALVLLGASLSACSEEPESTPLTAPRLLLKSEAGLPLEPLRARPIEVVAFGGPSEAVQQHRAELARCRAGRLLSREELSARLEAVEDPSERAAFGDAISAASSEEALRGVLASWQDAADPTVRALACSALPAHELAQRGLKDPVALVRIAAALAAGAHARAAQIAAWLAQEDDDLVQEALAVALAEHPEGAAEFVPHLPALSPRALRVAVESVGEAKLASAVPALTEILEREGEDLRAGVAAALQRIGSADPEALRALAATLLDRHEGVRRASMLALKSLLGRDFEFDPAAELPLRERAVGALLASLEEPIVADPLPTPEPELLDPDQ